MMRSFYLVFFYAFMALSTICSGQQRKLVVALEDWPPREYIESGEPRGINVEVISRIMKRLDIPVEFQFYPWARAWMLAEKGKIDAISNISHQPEREPFIFYTDEQKAFSIDGTMPEDYLWHARYVFFMEAHHKRSFVFNGYDDNMKNYRIGTVKDYSYDKAFREADLDKRTFVSAEKAFHAMAEGLIDLFPMENTIGTWMVGNMGIADKIKSCDTELFSKPYMLGFTRESDYPGLQGISKRFYEELAKMRASGEYQSIVDSYICPEYIRNLSRPLVFVCEEWAPLEYFKGEEIVGVDAAVVKHIMDRLGAHYEISIYPWSRAWMMAQKGKADAVLSISYKESREDVLYYTEDQREFARSGKVPENYLWMSEYVFFVMKKSTDKLRFESYEQLKSDGVTIGRNRDYSYCPEFLAAEFQGPMYSNTEDGLLALVSGEIDLYPMDKTVGQAELQRLGLQDSVTCLSKPLFSKPYLSPFCRKSDIPELEKIMNAFYRELRLMRADGSYDRIYKESLAAVGKTK